jgi:Ca2+-dependent lipid-binding protein
MWVDYFYKHWYTISISTLIGVGIADAAFIASDQPIGDDIFWSVLFVGVAIAIIFRRKMKERWPTYR